MQPPMTPDTMGSRTTIKIDASQRPEDTSQVQADGKCLQNHLNSASWSFCKRYDLYVMWKFHWNNTITSVVALSLASFPAESYTDHIVCRSFSLLN